MFRSPGDILFSVLGIKVYAYGVVMAFACLVGVYSSYLVYKKFFPEKDYDKIIDCASIVLILGIIGARLYYCLLNPVYYLFQPLEILNIRQGGLSIHGGLIAGILALIFFAKRYKLGVLHLLDSYACGTALAQAIGRWGNFFNSEAFGYPTDLPWKLYIPLSNRPDIFKGYDFFHPTFLYESILDFLMFVILVCMMKKYSKKYCGLVTFTYLVLYSFIRFFTEYLRIDSALNIAGIPVAIIVSGIMFLIGLGGIIFVTKK